MRERFRELFEKLSLSQARFAEAIGMTAQAFSNFMQGRTQSLSLEVLDEIKKKFSVNPLWLLAGEGEMFVSEVELKRDQATDQAVELSRFVNRNPEIRELVLGLKAIPAKNQSRLVKLLIKVLSHSTKDLERLEGYLDGMGK